MPKASSLLPIPLVMFLAKPYLAGETAEQAISCAQHIFRQDGFTATIDMLGEDMHSDDDCEKIVTSYFQLIDQVRARPLPCQSAREQLTISMKPSMFSPIVPDASEASRQELAKAFERIARVVDYGFQNQVKMTLEAEDHQWANFQLETYFALINAGYHNLGTVLQTRLFRLENDILRFDQRMRVRLVIGIYQEPAQIAHVNKRIMKELLVKYAGQLLKKGVYVEIASHDLSVAESFFREVVLPQRISPLLFEHQFLLGVPRKKLQTALHSGSFFMQLENKVSDQDKEFLSELKASGCLVRIYVPYGPAQLAGRYCRRRLVENPNIIAYGLKNLLKIT